MTTPQRDPQKPIADSHVFDLRRSHMGYRINRLCDSLSVAENRAAYKENELAYLDRYGLTEKEKQLVLARDFPGLLDAGGNIYYLLKLGLVTGKPLYHMGAQMRGETFEQFLSTRNNPGAV